MNGTVQHLAVLSPFGLLVWLTLRDPLRSAAAIASLTASLIAAITTNPSRRKAALRVVELARCDTTGKRPRLPEVLRVSKAVEDKPKG